MNKKIKTTGVILSIAAIVSLLVFVQYKYSSQTKVAKNLEYVETFSTGNHYDVAIFKHDGKYMAFSIIDGLAQWMVEGNSYDIEYKDSMWHRKEVLIVNTKERE